MRRRATVSTAVAATPPRDNASAKRVTWGSDASTRVKRDIMDKTVKTLAYAGMCVTTFRENAIFVLPARRAESAIKCVLSANSALIVPTTANVTMEENVTP